MIKEDIKSNYSMKEITNKGADMGDGTKYDSENNCGNLRETNFRKNVNHNGNEIVPSENCIQKKNEQVKDPIQINNNQQVRKNNHADNYEQVRCKQQNTKNKITANSSANVLHMEKENANKNGEKNMHTNNSKPSANPNRKNEEYDEICGKSFDENPTSNCSKEHAADIHENGESDKEVIKFEKKKKKSEKLKKERQKEIIIAYWLKGIANILNAGFKSGDIKGSNFIGKKIAEVLKKVVEISHWNSVYDLIEIIKYLGKEIIRNNKMFFIIPNIIRRVLTIIRAEHFKQLYLYNNNYIDNLNKNNNFIINTLTNKTVNNSFIYEREIINFERTLSFYFDNTSKQNTYKIPATNTLRHSIIEGITELIAEIDTSWEEAEQRTSYDLFMENDVILTMGYSVGVEKFLKNVNKKKDGISVIVVGGDINRNGFRMAQLLSADGVDTTYISDSAVFAVIPKVTKVVLGSVAVSSSGGAITKIGGYNIACSAQFNSKPVTIVLPLFKLIHDPLYDPLRQNELQPGPSMIYNDVENLHVRIPKYDYIPEHLITLYITEMGPVDSFQLYNITKKKYHPDDLDLSFD
ncbi:eukaryotic translation initiation factor 2b, subunit 2, putative [Plasmodium ovale curtisi]|uniref:Translation initiation factor eIF2B subunit beta n=2 Tax=Plasmodium ovale curtisi TaxID=864141 RepID=A0A1A8WB98_PLAOA|nr:eukaryotic translation initiation factor 2b, subunit 2, putative [Plasmodium ovale curtisi]